jgi:hypothetical protein
VEARYTKLIKVAVLPGFAILLALQFWAAASFPVTAHEALLYDRFVRPPLAETLHQASVNGDVLYTLLEKRSVGLFRVSELSLRLPAMIACGLYLWAILRICPTPPWLALALLPVVFLYFFHANGVGLSLALAAWAIAAAPKSLARPGLLLGLAVAAHFAFVIPAVLLAGIIIWRNGEWSRAIEGFLIPAVAASFIVLVLPLSLAPEAPSVPTELNGRGVLGVKLAVEGLRTATGTEPIRVGASPEVEPILSFYQSKLRLANWRISAGANDQESDYMFVSQQDATVVVKR